MIATGTGETARRDFGRRDADSPIHSSIPESETFDGGSTWGVCLSPVPGLTLLENAEGAARKRDLVRRSPKIRGRRKSVMLQGQQDFDQAGAAGGRQQVPNVRLNGTQHALSRLPRASLPKLRQALKLHSVTHRRSGGMTLDQVHLLGRPTSFSVCLVERSQLAF
jgi:hypothetical protein